MYCKSNQTKNNNLLTLIYRIKGQSFDLSTSWPGDISPSGWLILISLDLNAGLQLWGLEEHVFLNNININMNHFFTQHSARLFIMKQGEGNCRYFTNYKGPSAGISLSTVIPANSCHISLQMTLLLRKNIQAQGHWNETIKGFLKMLNISKNII